MYFIGRILMAGGYHLHPDVQGLYVFVCYHRRILPKDNGVRRIQILWMPNGAEMCWQIRSKGTVTPRPSIPIKNLILHPKFLWKPTEKWFEVINGRQKGTALDNIYIERFWGSVKRENIHLNPPNGGVDLYRWHKEYVSFYNTERRRKSLYRITPYEKFYQKIKNVS